MLRPPPWSPSPAHGAAATPAQLPGQAGHAKRHRKHRKNPKESKQKRVNYDTARCQASCKALCKTQDNCAKPMVSYKLYLKLNQWLGFTACSLHPRYCLYLILSNESKSFMKCNLHGTHSPPVHTLASHGSQVVATPLASRRSSSWTQIHFHMASLARSTPLYFLRVSYHSILYIYIYTTIHIYIYIYAIV